MSKPVVQNLPQASNTRIKFVIICVTVTLLFGYLFSSYWQSETTEWRVFSRSVTKIKKNSSKILQQRINLTSSDGIHSTQLWHMSLANENYFRLAKLLPCRTVEYSGGPKADKIDSCDHSSTNEFSTQITLEAQSWLYNHQHPMNCTNKRFAIIQNFATSGFGSTIHQVVWAFGKALADDRIAVYGVPGNWMYADCNSKTPDCLFLSLTNCSIPPKSDGSQTITIKADIGHWSVPVLPPVFQNRTFNWYRAQLVFYLMRFRPETLTHIQNVIAQQLTPPSIDLHHPYIAVYVRRSDKVRNGEMSQAYKLRQYFDLFDADVRRANISTVYINSEEEGVFNEFAEINKEKQGYYKLLRITAQKNIVYGKLIHMSNAQRATVALEFLTDLFIEVNADLHAGTLTSNWCRLVDEMRLVLGKTIPFYTPENRYLVDMRRKK